MGKGILIFVMASTLAGTAMYAAQGEKQLQQAADETEYKSEVLAREAAASAFNLLVGKVKRDFEGYRTNTTDLDYGKAKFDMAATDGEDGTVRLVVVGKYGNQEYEIVGSVSKSGANPLDAVTIVSPITGISLRDNYQINGGSSNHAIRVIWSATKEAFTNEMDANRVEGVSGIGDVLHDELDINVGLIRNKIQNFSGSNLITPKLGRGGMKDWWKDETKNSSSPAGTSSAPVVMRITKDVTFEGDFSGFGVLFVEGDLTFEDNASWNGLVYLAGKDAEFTMVNKASIVGAIIYDGTDSPEEIQPKDGGLSGGHFDVDVFDTPSSSREIYHQHAYDDKFNTSTIDVLTPGCKNGGLCWNSTVGASGLSEVEIVTRNTHNVSGTYELQVGSTLYPGDLSVPMVIKVNPAAISRFSVHFTSLCALAPSSPSDSQDKVDTRNGAFSIMVKDTGAKKYVAGSTDNTDSQSGVLYEMVTYHHVKKDEACVSGAPLALESQLWTNPKGDAYQGDDPTCESEDSNDFLYTDANARSKKWGTRKYQKGKNGKKSEKFWLPTGDCGVAGDVTDKKGKKGKKDQFTMEGDASISYNLTALQRLKSILSEMNVQGAAPKSTRLSSTPRKRDVVVKMDGTVAPK